MLIYHMSCKCCLPKDQVKIHSHSNAKTCPDHYGAKCLKRSGICKICKKRFDFSSRSAIPSSCQKCRQKMNYAREKNRRKTRTVQVDNDVILHFHCGCSTPRGEAKKSYVDGSRRFACEKHKDPVAHRVGVCAVCNKDFQSEARGRMPGTCKPCRRYLGIEVVESTPEFDARYRPNEKTDASVERSDCIHRLSCCDEWDGRAKVLPCLGCDQYQAGAIMEMATYRDSDPYLWAQGG